MSDHILDSNILIRYLRKVSGYKDLLGEIERKGWTYISAMTRLEILRGMLERERQDTSALLNSLETVPITSEIADLAGEMIRSWRGRGVILSDADAVIAATAIHHGLTLVTTNPRHFPMPELDLQIADDMGNLAPRQ
ncbi:MAG: type II toxin-antitoxin system VapC family toxin [Chloroflexota bacterium]